jgi:hypothetical protein
MSLCDICSTPGMGTIIGAEDMRRAVFKRGFDPFALGLVTNPMLLMAGAALAYTTWKNTIVAQDTSDWNICPKCLAQLSPYLRGTAKATGVTQATVSTNPLVGAMAGAAAKSRYAKTKKWWQFWK